MNIPEDFKEFIALLNAHEVRYLIVGGYAVGFHSRPKFTQDIDIWIENSEKNALSVFSAEQRFDIALADKKDVAYQLLEIIQQQYALVNTSL